VRLAKEMTAGGDPFDRIDRQIILAER